MRDDVVTNCTDEHVEQFLPHSIAIIQANTADNTTAETNVELVRLVREKKITLCTVC